MERAVDGATDRGPRSESEVALDLERFSALRRLASDPRKRFVVSMGGGGIPSLCGDAVLADLLERLGLREHVAEIWGTSAGAIVGGSWASGTKAPRMLEIVRELRSAGVTDVDWLHVMKALLLRPFGAVLPDAVLRGERSHEAMLAGLSAETFEECEIPFRCIACSDVKDGRREVFREGPLAPAISASMSLPGILLPRDEDGRPRHGFLDGGLVEKTPLYSPMAEHARLGDGRELVLLGTFFGVQKMHNAVDHGFIDRFLVTIDALADHLWEHQEQTARDQPGVTVLLLDAHIEPGSVYLDRSQIDRNCEQARQAFEDQLQDAKIALTLGSSCTPRRPCPV